MNPVVIIPTIFGLRRRRGAPAKNPLEVYDHPTAPGDAKELRRCLASLAAVKDMPPIILLVSSQASARLAARETVESAVREFPTLDVLVIGDAEAQLVRQRLAQLGASGLEDKVGLVGYAAMRNLALVVANVLKYDAAIFLEDDEVVEDADFISRAVYGLGKLTRRGVPILAKTGFYYNSEGTYRSKSQDKWYNRYWQQGKAFNAWIEHAMAGPRLSRSNHVCGGCLALHREAFRRLAFDPWIPRGEDLDYLIDLRMYGSDIWFDNKWSLVHLPPDTGNEGTRFMQDIYRWLYEFRKVEFSRTQIDLLPIPPSSLEPYPGPFLRPGITRRVKRTAFLRSLARPNKGAYRKAARAATREATAYAEQNCGKYFEFQRVWPEIMRRAEGDRMLSSALMQRMRLGAREELAAEETAGRMRVDSAPSAPKPDFDAGLTGQIRLDMGEEE
ncbi:MAG: hypothetical protein Q3963_03105 [Coriobacteriaceae bacterium]|nr:hypothetical protein [Coriobacteriaceae bacterium]MDO4890327.1 hypothetical protein [Coriobacteriaceae bacterium]